MRKSIFLTVVAFASLGSATRLQSRTASHLDVAATTTHQQFAELTAATLYGGEGQVFAQMRAEAANEIAFNIMGALKSKAKQMGKNAIGGLRKKYGMSEVSGDAEVAQYILSEIANGNPVYMKALGQVAHNAF